MARYDKVRFGKIWQEVRFGKIWQDIKKEDLARFDKI